MEFLVSASFIAAFIAGVAALFAPCCVTVLLPTYLASVFRNRIAVFSMTFIYFLGLLVVFLPIGLGAVALTQLFSSYHNLIFSAGSIFLIFLGIILLLGIQFSLPFNVHPQLKNANIGSVFSLGVFSGIATTCCAPVLAGVLALSILPGSFLLGGAYTLAYVLGMVVPLFIIAFRKTVGYSLFGRKIRLTASNLISGSMFLGFGVFVFYLSLTGNLVSHSSYQVSINIYLTKIIQFLSRYTSLLPEPFWALFFIGIFLLITGVAIKQFRSIRNL